jgi:hypothetical protein
MTSKELIQKLDSHMRVNKITRKSVADKLGVSSAEVSRKLAADNCGLREFISLLDAVGVVWFTRVDFLNGETIEHAKPYSGNYSYKDAVKCLNFDVHCTITQVAEKLNTTTAHVKRMLASENMKLSTFLKLTDAVGVTNDYFKFD